MINPKDYFQQGLALHGHNCRARPMGLRALGVQRADMSVGLFVSGVVTILANWITTHVHLVGGTFDRATLRAVRFR
jgi:hypothetical protein